MSYTYSSFTTALALEMVVPNPLDPNFVTNNPLFIAILPTIIDYAEQRCYRELDLQTAQTNQLFQMGAYSRAQAILAAASVPPPSFPNAPTPQQILTVERVMVLPDASWWWGPPTAGPPVTGPSQLYPVSLDYMDAVYTNLFPQAGPFGLPKFFAMRDDVTMMFGPAPDQAYFFGVWGEARPTPLYSAAPPVGGAPGSQTTFLTMWLPDLFLAAAMVAGAGYRHNFGAQGDDPRMAISWETQFQELLATAKNEETRKKFLGWGMMSSYQSPPAGAPAPGPAPPPG